MVNPNSEWHYLPAEQVIEKLGSHPQQGLDESAIARRREEFGLNVVTVQRGQGPLVRFLLQFHQPLIYILLAAALITAVLGEWIDCSVILGVVIVNAAIGFVQEAKALQAIAALARTLTTEATVIRGGQKRRIPSPDLVPGDIVLLQSGDQVPADLRLLRCRDLQIAEAALTGESVSVEKRLDPLSADTILADRVNMAYASTLATYGQGTGIIVATGDRTEVGRISQLIAAVDELQTPLTRRISQFSRILLYLILGLAAVNFAIGLMRGQAVGAMFLASVALAVAAIPEGLPAAVTITLAIGVARMAKRRAIIRKLPAVETLGSTTVICSDKTGTLTENQMTVTAIVAGQEAFAVTGVGYDPQGVIRALADASAADGETLSVKDLHGRVALLACLRAGVLCNDSLLVRDGARWSIQGDPTEGALIVAAGKAGVDASVLRQEWPRIDAIPFESEHQYMATLHDQGSAAPRIVYLKGSVESVLQRCAQALDAAGHECRLAPEVVHAQVNDLAARGLRVLAFARAELPAGTAAIHHGDVQGGLHFLGLQAMIDPPRAEAMAAVRACQSAGIRVKMITGDHARTAAAIAGQLGLDGVADVVTGADLTRCGDEQLPNIAETAAVFARVAPEQKLRLVRALQSRGHVVAMTGDGVNDAPALKQADIGVAMGRGGTDVAREACDIILTDDNFASIEAAVEEGRGVLDNLTKFIVWTLPTNIGEGLVVLLAVLVGMKELPISPVQILWVNMTTAVLLGLMLAFEPKEPGIMARPPRDPHSPILTRSLLMRIGLVSLLLLIGVFGLFKWMKEVQGVSLAVARTAAVNVFVVGELFYLFNCRSLTKSIFRIGVFSNRAAFGGVLAMTVLQLLFTYHPVMNRLFGSAPIDGSAWAAILLFGMLVHVIIEVEKRLRGHVLQGESLRLPVTADTATPRLPAPDRASEEAP